MGLCSDYALDAQIQKILFSLDLWVPKAAREVQIDNVAQQHTSATFSGFNRARSPTRNDPIISNSNVSNRLRRTLASRSMSAEVFYSSIDTGNNVSVWKNDSRDSNKNSTTLIKKSSNGLNLDEISQTNQSQIKLMPILEGGENDDKLIEQQQQQTRFNKEINLTTTTLDWTPTEHEPSTSTTTDRTPSDALFELSVRADTALKTALCENAAITTKNFQNNNNNDRITLRKSVSVMNQKQKTGSGRSLIRAKSDIVGTDATRKRALAHIARTSERYFSDDPKMIAEIEELELEYLFNYIRHLKTFPKYTNMTEDEILREVESDPHTLRQRTKEILKGKMSDSYANYIAKYPIKKQRRREHPTSPNKYRKCSRRCFDGQLRTWRRNLHQFDEDNKQDLPEINQPILISSIDDQAR